MGGIVALWDEEISCIGVTDFHLFFIKRNKFRNTLKNNLAYLSQFFTHPQPPLKRGILPTYPYPRRGEIGENKQSLVPNSAIA